VQALLPIDLHDMAIKLPVVFCGSQRAEDITMKGQKALENWMALTSNTFVQQP